MMQEEGEHKSAVLVMKGSKITARLLAKTMLAALRLIKRSRDAPGKQSIKQLSKGGALESVQITDGNIKAFDPIARKYGVRYHLVKDASEEPPRWLVFFRAKDADAMTAAFNEFAQKTLYHEKEKPSVRETMAKFREVLKNAVIDRTRHKQRSGPEL